MIYKNLEYLIKFGESNTEELGWVQLDKAIKEGWTKLDAAAYDLVYCLHRPESSIFESIDPDGEFPGPHVRQGKSVGDGTYRKKYRAHKGKKKKHCVSDRLDDHRKHIRDGLSPNEAEKYANYHKRQWDSFWKIHGYGPEVLKNTWVNLLIPQTLAGNSSDFATATSLYEMIIIFLHKTKYGVTSLTDLEFKDKTEEEMSEFLSKGIHAAKDRVVVRTEDFQVNNKDTHGKVHNFLADIINETLTT